MIVAAGIGATATIAGALLTKRQLPDKPKRPIPRKERKRRQTWLIAVSGFVSVMLLVGALPLGELGTSPRLVAVGSFASLTLSFLVPIRPALAMVASLAMLLASATVLPLASLSNHQPLDQFLGAPSIATNGAIMIATLILVATMNKIRRA